MNKILMLCAGIAVIGGLAFFVFKIPLNNIVIWGGILLCPLMHIFMMHGGHSNNKNDKTSQYHDSH